MTQGPEDVAEELRVYQAELQAQNDELQRAQREVEASRDRYRALFDQAPLPCLWLDRKGRVLEANHAAGRLLGVAVEQLVGRPLPALLDPPAADALYLHLGEVITGGGRAVLELELPLRGRTLWVRCESARFGDHSLTALVDLGPERRAEQRFRVIAESIDEVFYVREAGGELTYVSPAARLLAGWPDAVFPEDRARVDRLRSRAPEPTAEEEYRLLLPDGRVQWVRERVFAQPGTGRVVGLVLDITSRRALEASLREAQKLEAVATLASGVAHDFRNLLQGIMGCVQMASVQRAPDALQMYLDPVLDGCRRGNRLVEQLLAFARDTDSKREPVHLDAAIAGSAPLMRSLVGDTIWLEVRTRAPRGVVRATTVEIEQVLLNLAANARDAMPRGGTLTVSTHAEPGAVRIEVRDTGDGMDETTRARAFEPFFTTKQVGHGSGLGLSTVFGIVSDLGGVVELDSAPGRGTVVSLSLPLIDEDAVEDSVVRLGDADALSGRVLLAEDEALVRATLRMYLHKLKLDVVEASTGDEALRLAESEPFDLLLTDVSMPGMDGPALAERVRRLRPGVRVVYMSAHDPVELVARGKIEPSAVLLGKPFDQATLQAALRDALAPCGHGEAGSPRPGPAQT